MYSSFAWPLAKLTCTRSDLIIVLKDGMVAEQGTHRELLEKPDGVYSLLWKAQSQEATMESILDGRLAEGSREVREVPSREEQTRR